jgi:hypothetical protein
MEAVFDGDEVREVLEERFYQPPAGRAPSTRGSKRKKPPEDVSYKVICISLYHEDLARLDAMVAELKARGHRKMSRSALIRFALDTADLDALPKAY